MKFPIIETGLTVPLGRDDYIHTFCSAPLMQYSFPGPRGMSEGPGESVNTSASFDIAADEVGSAPSFVRNPTSGCAMA